MSRTITPDTLRNLISENSPLLLDVRRRDDLAADPRQIPGANWCDPELVQHWAAELPQDRDIVLYCVRGGSVSNSVLDHLLSLGRNARYIEGGLEAWKQSGGDTAP